MSFAFLNQTDIREVIDRLIGDGYQSFTTCDPLDQSELVVLAMSYMRGDAYTCIIEADDFDSVLSDMMRYMMNNTQENASSLAETLQKNAIQYFEEGFNELFEDVMKWRNF